MKKRKSVFAGVLIFIFGVALNSNAQTMPKSHDIEEGRARIERRVTDQERKAVAMRQAKKNPALAARIAANRNALINARNARIEEITTANATQSIDAGIQGGTNE